MSKHGSDLLEELFCVPLTAKVLLCESAGSKVFNVGDIVDFIVADIDQSSQGFIENGIAINKLGYRILGVDINSIEHARIYR